MMLIHDLALAIQRYEHMYWEMKPPMNIAQYIVMNEIRYGKTHVEADIAGKTGLQQAVVRDVIHKLIRKKYVRRKRGYVMRAKPMEITETGVKAWEKCAAVILRVDEQFMERTFNTLTSQREFRAMLHSVATT